jgi:hypothetical protein
VRVYRREVSSTKHEHDCTSPETPGEFDKLRAAALIAAFLAASAFGQQTENAIVIEAKDSATPTAPVASLSKYLNGYRSSIDGQTIGYHSSDPDADSAFGLRMVGRQTGTL